MIVNKFISISSFQIDLESINIQIFQTTISLFGINRHITSETVLLNLRKIQMKALMLFDIIPDRSVIGNQKQIMISVLAPEITYYKSLKLKNLLFSLVSNLKSDLIIDFKFYFEEIQMILIP